MNIWTSFFLVLSVVILAYPFLASGDQPKGRNGAAGTDAPGSWDDEELDLDLATGRLSREDYEAMGGAGQGVSPEFAPGERGG
jgi:hypothetical protein